MLSKNARKVLKELKRAERKSLDYHMIVARFNWDYRDVKSACLQLIDDGLVTEYTHSPMPGRSTPWGIVLSEKGRNTARYFWAGIGVFLMKSILTPIVVALITTLVTLWLKGVWLD